jgi:hypothetical protein
MRRVAPSVRLALAPIAAALVVACASQRFDGPDGDRRFYEARCGVCHVPLPREDYSPSQWPGILDEMAPRAGLTGPQRERVRAYLTSR